MLYHVIVVLLCSSCLFGLTEGARTAAIQRLVERRTRDIPAHLQDWLQEQSIATSRFGIEALRLDYDKSITCIGKIEHHMRERMGLGQGDILHAEGIVSSDEMKNVLRFEQKYANASYLLTPVQEYIASRAPAEGNFSDFWEALLEGGIKTVVTLVMPSEGIGYLSAYWEKGRFPCRVGMWTLTMIQETVIDSSATNPLHRIVSRAFMATHGQTKEKRTITHVHYENWPDRGTPDHPLFCRLLDYVDTIHPNGNDPIVVHCFAGVGRTGTFIAAHSIRKEIKCKGLPTNINIPRRIVLMRMQRRGMVNQAQEQAVFAAISTLIDQIGIFPKHPRNGGSLSTHRFRKEGLASVR